MSPLVSIAFLKKFLFLYGSLCILFPAFQLTGPRLLPTLLVEIRASGKEKK